MPGRERGGPTTLSQLAAVIGMRQRVKMVGGDVAVDDVYIDSRAVSPGSLFVAIRGATTDGHRFLDKVETAGAVAVAVEEPPTVEIPYLQLADTRSALGWIAAAVHGYPARRLSVVGITGTNGKTTVAHMLMAMTDGAETGTAVIGTVSANLAESDRSPRTTPEASDLQRMLRHLAEDPKIGNVAIEVSSHAMMLGRVNGIEFDVVAFTNLSQDHLDYHHTMEDYYRAKAGLFSPQWAPRGVVWIDDLWGRRLAAETGIPVLTVGTAPDADVGVSYGTDSPDGSTFAVTIAGRSFDVALAQAGRFNVSNAAVALTCAHLQGLDLDEAVPRLATMQPIPGRYNTVATGRDLWVVVDYAHTPDAIARVIRETRPLVTGRLIAVVGAGGDRDRQKRPLMGEAASTADLAVITTDNPRSEDPGDIIDEVAAGIPEGHDVLIEPDRRVAIRRALRAAVDGDAVLILGKGHETGQEFAGGVVPFDDRLVVTEELRQLYEGTR